MSAKYIFDLWLNQGSEVGRYSFTCCKNQQKSNRVTYSEYSVYRMPCGTPVIALTCQSCGYIHICNLKTAGLSDLYQQLFPNM